MAKSVNRPTISRHLQQRPKTGRTTPDVLANSQFSPGATNCIRHLHAIREYVNKVVLEREMETDGLLLAALSGSSVFFLGDVGTSKTRHVRIMSELFSMRCFDTLMSETTKPEQVFGPTDVPALARGIQRYKIDNYAPAAEFLFFDELFKASSIVLNPLLWILNEHKFRNGDQGIIDCPTRIAVAASNEIPGDADLRPTYDRFLMRYHVHYLKSPRSLNRMIDLHLNQGQTIQRPPPISLENLDRLRQLRSKILVPDEVRTTVFRVKDQVQRACNIDISDRRIANSISVMQASALLDGRKSCNISDVAVLASIFWEKPDHIPKVRAIAISAASSSTGDIVSYEEIAEDVWAKAIETGDMETAEQKLSDIVESVRNFSTTAGQQVARTVVGYLSRVRSIIRDRQSFIVTEMISGRTRRGSKNQGYVYKIADATATAWTHKQLRGLGFHWFKKSGYWWMEGPSNETQLGAFRKRLANDVLKQLNVVVRFRRLG